MHYGANNTIRLTFKTGIAMTINSVSYTVSGWWCDANYDSNTIGSFGGVVKAGSNGIKQYSLIMRTGNDVWCSFTTTHGTGTTKSKNTNGFILDKLLYHVSSSNFSSGSYSSTCYAAYAFDFRYSTNCGTSLTKGLETYIVGTINSSDGKFYLDDTWWTQTKPTSADGKTYIYVGIAYSTYQIYLDSSNAAYQFYDGEFRTLTEIEAIKNSVVSIDISNINWAAGTATLTAVLRIDGVIKTPSSYKWTKGTSTTSVGTNSTLNITDLNAVYNCTVTW